MEDHEVVAAIVAGDSAGLGEAYDRYAVALYAYCRSMLREPADAADVVQDTFVVAVSKLSGLRDPAKLRAWLYAVARNECMRRLRAGRHTFALDEAADLAGGDPVDVGNATERADLRELVRDAIDGLNPGDRDVIELSLGHALDGDDLAATMGLPRNHAHALLSRARGQLERSLGALIVARTGQHACPELRAMLVGWDGRLTVLIRKRISRHIERCEICGERKRRELTPALFAAGLPLAVLALRPGFREQVLRLCADNTHAALAHRAGVLGHAGRFGPAGFPKSLSPPGTLPWRGALHHSPAVVTSAAASTAAAVIAVLVIGIGPHHGQPSAGPGSGVRPNAAATVVGGSSSPGSKARKVGGAIGLVPSASGAATVPGQPGTPGTPSTTSTPGATGTPGANNTPGATGSPSPSFSASGPSPTVSSSSAGRGEGTLVVSPGTVTLVRRNGGAAGTLTLTASGGPISHYEITVRSAHELSVSPSSGSLTAGQSVTVIVTTNSPGPINTWIVVNPGGNKVTVQLS